jgi:diguanylate cyclase (GGDEF)-like protein
VPTLAKVATRSIATLCVALSVSVIAVAVIGVIGAGSSATLGKEIAGDELASSTATGELARDMGTSYAVGEEAFLTANPALRSKLLGWLYTTGIPATDAEMATFEQLNAADPPAQQAGIEQFVRQWTALRSLLSPTSVATHPMTALAADLSADYQPVGTHLDQLLLEQQAVGHSDQAQASSNEAWTAALVIGVALLANLTGLLILLRDVRRIRRSLEPGWDQADFVDTLQLANDEDEAHRLLQRHLERTLAPAAVVVLNINNSADRLEAASPLPVASPLAATLRGAEPRSCLAVRSGRTHTESSARPPLLPCPVCGPCNGVSSCVPIAVGGQVIGSVLLIRPVGHELADEQRIRESVSQAAPVLANLRNLAIAEMRAATDGLTGLPNKRAVTDTLKRMYGQAATTGAPLALLLLDLDHFKQINDVRGHPLGDQVLAKVGAVLQGVLRTGDFAGRNGGEEFAIILPDTDIGMAVQVAERVRTAVAEISLPGTDVTITTSIGIAGYPDHATTPERLERLADAALYVAKRQGRNRTEVAEPTPADIARNLADSATIADPPTIPDSPTTSDSPTTPDSPTNGDSPTIGDSPTNGSADVPRSRPSSRPASPRG